MKRLMSYLNEQSLYASGAVDRGEFEPTRVRDLMDPVMRKRVESAVWKSTPERHRFKAADGQRGVVFFDDRGRASSQKLSEMSTGELSRLYERTRAKVRPATNAQNHGYQQPVQEQEGLDEAKLVTKADLKKLPLLYSQDDNADPKVWVKFFNPYGQGTWLATEYDGKDKFFGAVKIGGGWELGYFSLRELQSLTKFGAPQIERDRHFKPQPLSSAKRA